MRRGTRRKRLAGRRLEEASACPAAKPPKSPDSSARRIMRPHVSRPSALHFVRCSRTRNGVRKARRAEGGGAPLHATTPSAAVHGRARQAPLSRRQATAPQKRKGSKEKPCSRQSERAAVQRVKSKPPSAARPDAPLTLHSGDTPTHDTELIPKMIPVVIIYRGRWSPVGLRAGK